MPDHRDTDFELSCSERIALWTIRRLLAEPQAHTSGHMARHLFHLCLPPGFAQQVPEIARDLASFGHVSMECQTLERTMLAVLAQAQACQARGHTPQVANGFRLLARALSDAGHVLEASPAEVAWQACGCEPHLSA